MSIRVSEPVGNEVFESVGNEVFESVEHDGQFLIASISGLVDSAV